MVEEIPKANFAIRASAELVVAVEQEHPDGADGFELEKELLGHKVVFVDNSLHRDQEKVAVRFAGNLHQIDLGVTTGER